MDEHEWAPAESDRDVAGGGQGGGGRRQPAKQRAASFEGADRRHEVVGRPDEGEGSEKAFQEAMKEKADEARADRKAEHQRRAAKKQQKEENIKRTGIIKAEVTNPKTIAKHAKMRKATKKQKALKM